MAKGASSDSPDDSSQDPAGVPGQNTKGSNQPARDAWKSPDIIVDCFGINWSWALLSGVVFTAAILAPLGLVNGWAIALIPVWLGCWKYIGLQKLETPRQQGKVLWAIATVMFSALIVLVIFTGEQCEGSLYERIKDHNTVIAGLIAASALAWSYFFSQQDDVNEE